jgi:hypothetical protein
MAAFAKLGDVMRRAPSETVGRYTARPARRDHPDGPPTGRWTVIDEITRRPVEFEDHSTEASARSAAERLNRGYAEAFPHPQRTD